MSPSVSVCILAYGDYPSLLRRCLSSIQEGIPIGAVDLRIGLNAVSEESQEIVADLPMEATVWNSKTNLHKYPMMREMFWGDEPLTSEYVMWFDDDSYLGKVDKRTWLPSILRKMKQADMLGSVYTIPWRGNQVEWIRAQPWYKGLAPKQLGIGVFATGGWWVARTEVLRQLDYPWPCLDHRGGDVMLGEALRQQGLKLQHFKLGVHINADEHGRESKSTRRGFDQKPIGV